jgi:hypothetical protein
LPFKSTFREIFAQASELDVKTITEAYYLLAKFDLLTLSQHLDPEQPPVPFTANKSVGKC